MEFLYFAFLLLLSPTWIRSHSISEGKSGPKDRELLDLLPFNKHGLAMGGEIIGGRGIGQEDPNVDDYRIVNTVLAQMQRAKAEGRNIDTLTEKLIEASKLIDVTDEFSIYPEYTESLPETSERETRHIRPKHASICNIEKRIIALNDEVFEYRPAHYEEIKCAKSEYDNIPRNDVCSTIGFLCYQWNKTIHLTRRRYESGCWETDTRIIPAGCECMWPGHKFGDIKLHI